MTAAGIVYGESNGDRPIGTAALRGVAAAATGLIAATWFQIGKKIAKGFYDAFFVMAAILGINHFKCRCRVVLLVGRGSSDLSRIVRTQSRRSRTEEEQEWIRSLQ